MDSVTLLGYDFSEWLVLGGLLSGIVAAGQVLGAILNGAGPATRARAGRLILRYGIAAIVGGAAGLVGAILLLVIGRSISIAPYLNDFWFSYWAVVLSIAAGLLISIFAMRELGLAAYSIFLLRITALLNTALGAVLFSHQVLSIFIASNFPSLFTFDVMTFVLACFWLLVSIILLRLTGPVQKQDGVAN